MKHGARIGMGMFASLGIAAVLLVTGCAQQKPMGQEAGGWDASIRLFRT